MRMSRSCLDEAADGSRPSLAYSCRHAHARMLPDRHFGLNLSEGRIAEFSLKKRARFDLSPFFLCHATDDKFVLLSKAELQAASLCAVNVRSNSSLHPLEATASPLIEAKPLLCGKSDF
jgi:hypothetical protein